MRRFSVCFASVAACVAPGHADSDLSYQLSTGKVVAPLERFRECDVCPEMIVMPPGAFMMGATKESSRFPYDMFGKDATFRQRGRDEIHIIRNEHPRHLVEMDIPFAIGRNEVTHAEWMACVEAGGCSHVPDHRTLSQRGYVSLGPDHPVINVSFLDAVEFADWVNSQIGDDVYRLPTEAEWEYAARAGTTTRFAQGDDLDSTQANFLGRVTEQTLGVRLPHLKNRDTVVAVDELDAANGWGVRHMSGNVWEFTRSCWSDEHLGLPTDSAYLARTATCPVNASAHRRVAKGGGFQSGMDNLRPARRTRPSETSRRDFTGFRLIREFKKENE